MDCGIETSQAINILNQSPKGQGDRLGVTNPTQ